MIALVDLAKTKLDRGAAAAAAAGFEDALQRIDQAEAYLEDGCLIV